MKILVITEFGQSETADFPEAPRIGDTIPLFFKPYPKVTSVCWLPHKVMPELVGSNTAAIVTVA